MLQILFVFLNMSTTEKFTDLSMADFGQKSPIQVLDSIIARGSPAPTKTIGNSQYFGNSMLPGHVAHTLRRNLKLNANGCDKEWVPRSATKNLYDVGARFNSLERSLGDANYWRASAQGLI